MANGIENFKIVPIAKPLLSVSALVDKGWHVVFGKEAYMTRNGVTIPLEKNNGV